MAHTMVKLTATVCAAALSVAVPGGCMPQQQTSAASQAQSDNRAYMTQVNQTMETLQTRLNGFSDAVSRGDVVTMRTQADNAFKALDELDSQEAPDALGEEAVIYRRQRAAGERFERLYRAVHGNRQRNGYAAVRLVYVRPTHC